MKEELYQWIWNLAVFYILFTAILHLAPDGKYEKYVRFFMGLLLIFMMSTPVFALFGKGQELAESFQLFYEKQAERGTGTVCPAENLSPEKLSSGASQKNPGIFAEYWNRSAECGSKYKRGENTGRDHRKGRTCAGTERKDC